jgi:hypothetical protein
VWDFITCVITGLNTVYLYEYLCKNLCEFCVKFGLPSELHATAEHSAGRACSECRVHAACMHAGARRWEGKKKRGEERSINKR